ncbi:hypothetical protein RB595_001980 [Gaeumannomyces hyphopodioides]
MASTATPLNDPLVTVLGPDPRHRNCVLNGNAFQQDAITSHNGWQYAVFYSPLRADASAALQDEQVFVHVARRKLPAAPWEVLVLDDYPQTVDDGHNTAQMGICAGDGTIHLSYDHHCDVLRYRHSVKALASDPDRFPWTSALFTPTLDHLPGLPRTHEHFGYVTYPRFGPAGCGGRDMFMSFRTGKAGLGDDHLYVYRAGDDGGRFEFVGTHLVGVKNNPYVHGMDYQIRENGGRLHVTWVYRGFVHYDGWDDPLDTKHKQQAGPNGAENNHDLCYAYSDDDGRTWRNTHGALVADLGGDGRGVTPDAPGLVVFDIPKGSGLTNQESQAVGADGGVHVLNRTFGGEGRPMWRHFYREPAGPWEQHTIGPVTGGKRGRLAVTKSGDLLVILPDSDASTLRILRAAKENGYAEFQQVWQGSGLSGEPLADARRLQTDGTLSVFAGLDAGGSKNVVVLDFKL